MSSYSVYGGCGSHSLYLSWLRRLGNSIPDERLKIQNKAIRFGMLQDRYCPRVGVRGSKCRNNELQESVETSSNMS
ncbi:hypothetical protein J6590_001708 [Homalodisca vitripennis]|nr:hypothetical protein J6590_001708 [Homalodisca vitripennis]